MFDKSITKPCAAYYAYQSISHFLPLLLRNMGYTTNPQQLLQAVNSRSKQAACKGGSPSRQTLRRETQKHTLKTQLLNLV